jgi:hypothetical protein
MSLSQEDRIVGLGAIMPFWFQDLIMGLALGISHGHFRGRSKELNYSRSRKVVPFR